MPDKDELINIDKGEPLDIFTEEKDQKGTDLYQNYRYGSFIH